MELALNDKDYDEKRVNEIRKLIAAHETGEGTSPEESATVADAKTFKKKQQMAVGTGECDEAEALENLIDRKTAQYCTWFENNAPLLVEKGCEYVGSVIGAFLGNPLKGKAIGRFIGKKLGSHPLVKKGANLIATYCKRVVQAAKTVASNVVRVGRSILKAVFG